MAIDPIHVLLQEADPMPAGGYPKGSVPNGGISAKVFAAPDRPDQIIVQLTGGIDNIALSTWDGPETPDRSNFAVYVALQATFVDRLESHDLSKKLRYGTQEGREERNGVLDRDSRIKGLYFDVKAPASRDECMRELATFIEGCKADFAEEYRATLVSLKRFTLREEKTALAVAARAPIEWRLFTSAAHRADGMSQEAVGVQNWDAKAKTMLASAFYNVAVDAKGRSPEEQTEIATKQARHFLITSNNISDDDTEQKKRVSNVAKLALDYANSLISKSK